VYWRTTIETPLPPEEAMARVRALIRPRMPSAKRAAFQGEVGENTFRLKRAPSSHSVNPILHGRIETGPNGGALVHVEARIRYLLLIVVGICGCAFYVSDSRTPRYDIILAALAILLVAFGVEVSIGLRTLRKALAA